MDKGERSPLLLPEGDIAGATCEPTAYVSNEEAAILAAVLELRAQAETVRARLATEKDPDKRRALDDQLGQLRVQRTELVSQREAAYRRKMVMLGHLPLDEE